MQVAEVRPGHRWHERAGVVHAFVFAFGHRLLELLVAPVADTGFVGGQVRGVGLTPGAVRSRELHGHQHPAVGEHVRIGGAKRHIGRVARQAARGVGFGTHRAHHFGAVAIVAAHDADEVASAFHLGVLVDGFRVFFLALGSRRGAGDRAGQRGGDAQQAQGFVGGHKGDLVCGRM